MKRSYPFEDFFSCQSKCHVGEKEVNMGVQRDVNMHSVYAKTMQKLREGARNLSNNNLITFQTKTPHACADSDARATTHNSLRQMALTTQGGIRLAAPAVCSTEVNGAAAPPFCSECGALAAAAGNCSFCESPLCGACSAGCSRCGGTFCRHCRVLAYDSREDIIVCLSCNA